MKAEEYSVKTDAFEGPLDLLLDLVSKRKLFISDVSLASVTDDYIRYIDEHEEFPIGEAAEFIVIASTLMLIKSRSLLPSLKLTEEEEESIDDLEERLALYARAKELAQALGKIYGKRVIYEKEPRRSTMPVFSPDSKTDKQNLFIALEKVMDALPKKERIPTVAVKKIISLEETIGALSGRVAKCMKMKFSDFSERDKVTVIVGFLAMLELVKRGAIRATQEADGEIEIESENVGVPTYI